MILTLSLGQVYSIDGFACFAGRERRILHNIFLNQIRVRIEIQLEICIHTCLTDVLGRPHAAFPPRVRSAAALHQSTLHACEPQELAGF